MSIFDQIFGSKKKKDEDKPEQVAEDVAKARREELARRKQEAEDARIRAEASERQRLEALAKEKQQPTQAVPGVIPGAYMGGIPGVIPGVVPGQAKPAEPRVYIVEEDDYLSKIAKKVYGDAHRWPEIYEANKDIIGPDPNIIHGGQKLRIP
jgi:nucleoid-associated protein YgaU